MHRAVNPKPVAAALASVRLSPPLALARSRTKPVFGSASFQKYAKAVRSTSSSNAASSRLAGLGGKNTSEVRPLPARGKTAVALITLYKKSRRVQVMKWEPVNPMSLCRLNLQQGSVTRYENISAKTELIALRLACDLLRTTRYDH